MRLDYLRLSRRTRTGTACGGANAAVTATPIPASISNPIVTASMATSFVGTGDLAPGENQPDAPPFLCND